MADAVSDWMVADSEDEDAFAVLPLENGPGASTTDRGDSTSLDSEFHSCRAHPFRNHNMLASVIQTAAFTPDRLRTPQKGPYSLSTMADESLFTPPPARMDSTIDNFTSTPPTSDVPIAIVPKPRPRPRPRVVIKKAAAFDPNADVVSDPPISATRQASDSIHPVTATSFDFFEVAGDVYSLDIAERAKMRSRKKTQTAKNSAHLPDQMNEVIELTTDDDDELSMKPTKRQKKQGNPKPKAPAKPRPKPRLKVKPVAVIPNDSPSNGTAIRLPDALSLQHASSSQLPASTLPTVPPSTPPQAREPSPLSSPLVTTRKRKRIRPSIAEDDDELDILGSNPIGGSPSLTEPPPFFAASTSSLPTDSGIEIPPVESPSGRSKKKQSSNKKGTQAKTQNKGKRGKKGEVPSAAAEIVEESAGITQEPSTPAGIHSPNERHSSAVKDSTTTKKGSGKQSMVKKGKARVIHSCDEDDEPVPSLKSSTACMPSANEGEGQRSKVHKLSFP